VIRQTAGLVFRRQRLRFGCVEVVSGECDCFQSCGSEAEVHPAPKNSNFFRSEYFLFSILVYEVVPFLSSTVLTLLSAR
jgi:hypothetical protein